MDHGKSQLHRRLPKTRQFDTHHRPTFRAAPGHRAGRLVCLKAVGSMGQPKRGRLRRVAVRTPAPGHASLPRHPCGVLTSLASSPVDHDVDPGGHGECPTECRHHLWPVDPDDEHPPGPLGNHIHDPRTASTPKLMTCAFRSAAEAAPPDPTKPRARRARRATGLPWDRRPSWACRHGRGRLSCPRRWSRGATLTGHRFPRATLAASGPYDSTEALRSPANGLFCVAPGMHRVCAVEPGRFLARRVPDRAADDQEVARRSIISHPAETSTPLSRLEVWLWRHRDLPLVPTSLLGSPRRAGSSDGISRLGCCGSTSAPCGLPRACWFPTPGPRLPRWGIMKVPAGSGW